MSKVIAIIFLIISQLIFIPGVYCQDDPRCCNPPCYDNTEYCSNPGNWRFGIKEIILPEFPGCRITVHYCWRECRGQNQPHTSQIKICKIFFLYDCDPCNQVWLFLIRDGRLDPRRIRQFVTMLIKQITLELFIFWYEGAPQSLKDMVECGTGYHVKYQWWRGACVATCYWVDTDQNGNLKRNFLEIDCYNGLYCCGIEYKYCYNSVEQRVERIETRLSDPNIDCVNLPPPPPTSCPDAIDKEITNCWDTCNQ